MPDSTIHWDQAEHNESMVKEIVSQNPIKYKDWAEIVSFYSAIHFVEAYMADQLGLHSAKDRNANESPHHYRTKIVRDRLSRIQYDYDELLIASKLLRYLTDINGSKEVGTKGDYLSEDDLKDFFNENLQNIKMEIAQILGISTERYTV